MKKLKKNLLGFAYALPAMLLIAGCGNSADPVFETNEPVELQITPTVALTRGVITNGTQNGAPGHITEIAVYATGTDYGAGNNYAKYSYSSSSWGNSDANNKIYLTNAEATLYAYHPASATLTSNTIPVTIKETGTIVKMDNASSTTTIAAASDETDYLYATSATADNTKAKRSVALTMNHALSMVSFRVYGENYKGPGTLTQIVLKNADNKTALTKGASNTMNITTGAITQTSAAATTYTRTITGYTLETTSAAANKLSILVLPISGKNIPADEIKAEFTIDGAVYSVSLTDPTGADGWLAGNNNLYSVKLSGTELSISNVEVTAWAEKVGGDLEIK